MLKPDLKKYLELSLTARLSVPFEIDQVKTVQGGDINAAYQLRTDKGDFFLKTNQALKFPKMFEREAEGLKALSATKSFQIPSVIDFGSYLSDTFLLLSWVEQGAPSKSFWDDFGYQLAKLHTTTAEEFGWNSDNYIGSLVQHNQQMKSWSDFFVLQRLEPQAKMAREAGLLGASHLTVFEQLFHRMEDLFPVEPPALVHGDLWSGNYMITAEGKPLIMDPAVYFGHREMDLAMTRLFGGFDDQLYRSYNEVFPLEAGWEERMSLCNLYPLLVHVNLFGGGYVSQVEQVLRRFA